MFFLQEDFEGIECWLNVKQWRLFVDQCNDNNVLFEGNVNVSARPQIQYFSSIIAKTLYCRFCVTSTFCDVLFRGSTLSLWRALKPVGSCCLLGALIIHKSGMLSLKSNFRFRDQTDTVDLNFQPSLGHKHMDLKCLLVRVQFNSNVVWQKWIYTVENRSEKYTKC